MSSLAQRSLVQEHRTALESLIVGLASLGLFLIPWSNRGAGPAEIAVLALASIVVAALPIRLPGERPPISLLVVSLVPSWLLAGPVVTLALAWLAHLAATLAPRPVRLLL